MLLDRDRLTVLAGCHKMWSRLPKDWEDALSKSAVAEARAVQQPSLLKRVQEILGVRHLRSDQDLVRLVEERLDVAALAGLRQSGLTDDEIYSLIVPRR